MFAVYLLYISLSVLLFYFGPLSYPMVNVEVTLMYILLCYGTLFSGMFFGSKFIHVSGKQGVNLNPKIIYKFFSIVSILFATFIIYKVSNGYIFDSLMKGVFDSGDAYYSNLQSEKESSVITQLMTFFSPLTILALTLGATLFKEFNLNERLLFILLITINVMSYIVKGTNFGVFLTLVPVIIAIILNSQNGKLFTKKTFSIYLLFSVFLIYFLLAMATRLNIDYIPTRLSGVLINKEFFLFKILPNSVSLSVSVASSYISQGYYGLSLAFNYPFDSTYGFGSGSFILSKFGNLVDPELWNNTYQYKMHDLWSSSIQWHTAFLWLANDVSLFGVFILLFIFGAFSAVVYKEAKINNSFLSKGLFSVITIILFFLPANNILGGNPFIFASFVSLSLLWFLTRRVYLK